MKIEFQCQQCRSTLRLGIEHQGKNVRCPVCGSVTLVAAQGDSGGATTEFPRADSPMSKSGWQSIEGGSPGTLPPPQPFFSGDSPEATAAKSAAANPYQATTASTLPGRHWNQPQAHPAQSDGYWWAGLYCGLASIACHFLMCCCMGSPFISLLLAFAGVTATLFSRTGPKWVNFLLAGIGGGIALLMVGLALLALVVGG